MLVVVIVTFLVFSFTGVAVLDVAYNSRSAAIETTHNITLQYDMESSINEALWLINTGEDSLVNEEHDGVTCTWDSLSKVLTVNVNRYGMESEVALNLAQDTHFEHGLASSTPIITNGFSTGITGNKGHRKYSFIPEVDLEYFTDNAVKTHGGNDHSWKDNFLDTEGIHIFTGNNLTLDSISVTNSTLVFTGKSITLTGMNYISSGTPTDSTSVLPAIIFTNPDASFTIADGNIIEGAVFCAGEINLGNATLTGPVIGQSISLDGDINLLVDESSEYYQWTQGFGEQDSYDWPKNIDRWSVNSWTRKSS